MSEYIDKLTEKWGPFVKCGECLSNGRMPFISSEARLNAFFTPKMTSDVSFFFANSLKSEEHPELKDIYAWTNGCRLFFASLCIYGIRDEKDKDILVPFDLKVENDNLSKNMPVDKYLFFASIGGEYVFGYDRYNPSEVYGMRVGDKTILQSFDGVKDFFDQYFYPLMEEYDEKCKKIHPTEAYRGIPVLENKTIELM